MDHLCENSQCQGIENYCNDPSHSLAYFCDCRQARKEHDGHSVRMVDLESFTDCISRIQKDCVEKKQEFTLKANECIEKILETLSECNSKLEEVIQECKKAKQTLNSPQTRLRALEEYIDIKSPEETLRRILEPRVDKAGFYMKIQIEMALLSKGIERPVVSEEIQEFLRYPGSVTSVKVATEVEFRVLVSVLRYSNISTLDLRGNEIGDQGAKTLASALPASQLTTLRLGWNGIGVEGAKALASALPGSQLTTLILGENEIGDQGAKALEEAESKLPDLRILR